VKNLFIVDGSIWVTSGGVNPTSTIQALALYISDSIKKRLATLFDPLLRDPSSKDEARLGLGLYIARQIAMAHGGTIDVESTEATGTQFTVRLPVVHISVTR